MDHDRISGFFSQASRIVFVVAVIILLTGIAIRYKIFNHTAPEAVRPTPVPEQTNRSTFSLKSPFVCRFENKTATMSAYKKNTDILFRSETPATVSSYLVKGDCMYIWTDAEKTGKRTCGFGKPLRTMEYLISFGIINTDTIMNNIPDETLAPYGIRKADAEKILQSCRNKDTGDVFRLPKEVSFPEAKK